MLTHSKRLLKTGAMVNLDIQDRGHFVRVMIKNTCCPWCAGELVVDGVLVTCIDDCECHNDELEYHPETMAKIQPVIDWQKSMVLDSQEQPDAD